MIQDTQPKTRNAAGGIAGIVVILLMVGLTLAAGWIGLNKQININEQNAAQRETLRATGSIHG